jgi:steroid delta-isomerase-like uncharacterized protein
MTRLHAKKNLRWPLLGALLFCLPVTAPAVTPSTTAASSDIANRNAQLGRRYFEEVWNRGNLAALDQLLTADYINHAPSTPNPPRGADGLKPIVAAIRKAFPDLHFEIEDVIATTDAVVVRTRMTGTHRGDFFGVAPTGRRVSVNQINIERIRDGRIAEHWRVTDELTLMRQLGVVPAP